jgi:hypothetical protein
MLWEAALSRCLKQPDMYLHKYPWLLAHVHRFASDCTLQLCSQEEASSPLTLTLTLMLMPAYGGSCP